MNKKRRVPSYRRVSSYDPAITVEEAAVLLKVSEAEVRRLCRLNQLPAGKFGKLWRIIRDELLKRMMENERHNYR